MALTQFIILYIHHHSIVLKRFHHPKQKLYKAKVPHAPLLPAPDKSTFHLCEFAHSR